jgi:hypothetical protein
MLFDETVKWKILTRFFQDPRREYYVKELSRELRISPGSASQVCASLEKEGVLRSEKKAKALFYSLKNDEPFVRRLKSAWFIGRLMRFRDCWEDAAVQSFALYGSMASGTFDSRSDIDVLAVSNSSGERLEKSMQRLKTEFGDKLALTVFTVAEWRELARKKDRFYIEVLADHIVLSGSPLVVG